MIKLICSDIDGTLLPEGTAEINPEIFDVIRKLKEKDIIFAAASGRPYSSIVRLFESVKNDIIFVSENGAYVSCRAPNRNAPPYPACPSAHSRPDSDHTQVDSEAPP